MRKSFTQLPRVTSGDTCFQGLRGSWYAPFESIGLASSMSNDTCRVSHRLPLACMEAQAHNGIL